MRMKAKALTALPAAVLLLLLLASACGGGDEDTDGLGGGGGGEPDRDVVQILQSLPVFPKADPASLAGGKYTYSPGASESGRDLQTGFHVLPNTTPEEVTSFFGKELPSEGWEEEAPPWTEIGEKEGGVSKTVIYSFLKGDTRLRITIPLVHKDVPEGVINVDLALTPKEVQFGGSPVGTRIDSTPPPAPTQVTPTYTAPPVPSYAPTPVTPAP